MSEDDQGKNALPADEKALLDRCSGEVMLFRLKGPLSFGAAKGISERMMLVRTVSYTHLTLPTMLWV